MFQLAGFSVFSIIIMIVNDDAPHRLYGEGKLLLKAIFNNLIYWYELCVIHVIHVLIIWLKKSTWKNQIEKLENDQIKS